MLNILELLRTGCINIVCRSLVFIVYKKKCCVGFAHCSRVVYTLNPCIEVVIVCVCVCVGESFSGVLLQ